MGPLVDGNGNVSACIQGCSWAGLNTERSADVLPISPLVTMFQLGSAAPEDVEPDAGNVLPQQEGAMFGDHIIGEHDVKSSDDCPVVCKPWNEDVDLFSIIHRLACHARQNSPEPNGANIALLTSHIIRGVLFCVAGKKAEQPPSALQTRASPSTSLLSCFPVIPRLRTLCRSLWPG